MIFDMVHESDGGSSESGMTQAAISSGSRPIEWCEGATKARRAPTVSPDAQFVPPDRRTYINQLG